MKHAFTMIELIFVVVILGILAAVAIPKFNSTVLLSKITKGKADLSSIRSGIISERQTRLIVGCPDYIEVGQTTYTCNSTTYKQINNGGLFGAILLYPIVASTTDGWSSDDLDLGVFKYNIGSTSTTFTYTPADGKFVCTSGAGYCDDLVN